jgi:hypothetical protein
MAGIAGITNTKEHLKIKGMNQRMSHRGREHHKSIEASGTLLQAVWNDVEASPAPLPCKIRLYGTAYRCRSLRWNSSQTTRRPLRWRQFKTRAYCWHATGWASNRCTTASLPEASLCLRGQNAVSGHPGRARFPPGFMYTPTNGFTPFATIKSETLPTRG